MNDGSPKQSQNGGVQPSGGSRPRMHHYLPASYLRRFVDNDGLLHIWDMLENRVFKSKPQNAARERDFYTIETPGNPADTSVEESIGNIEAKASPVIDKIIQNNELPEGDDWVNLAVFIGLLDQRIPLARKMHDEVNKAIQRMCARQLLGDKEYFEKGIEQYRKATGDVRPFTHDDAQRVLESEEYMREPHQNEHIGTMLQASLSVSKIASEMTTDLLVSRDGDFITGDCPLPQFNRADPRAYAGGWRNPAIEITFPLGRRHCLILFWGSKSRVVEVENGWVANANLQIARKSQRYVFASSDEFMWLDQDNSTHTDLQRLHGLIGASKKDFKTIEFFGGMAEPPNQAKPSDI